MNEDLILYGLGVLIAAGVFRWILGSFDPKKKPPTIRPPLIEVRVLPPEPPPPTQEEQYQDLLSRYTENCRLIQSSPLNDKAKEELLKQEHDVLRKRLGECME